MRFQTGYYFRKGMVVHKTLKKVGLTVYGSGNTIVKKTFFFRVSRWGRKRGGGLVRSTLQYMYCTCICTCICTSYTSHYEINPYIAMNVQIYPIVNKNGWAPNNVTYLNV